MHMLRSCQLVHASVSINQAFSFTAGMDQKIGDKSNLDVHNTWFDDIEFHAD
jgi:hypothetical protein